MKKLLFAAALATGALMAGGVATAGAATEVVTNNDVSRQAEDTTPVGSWVIYTRTASPGTATFRSGPATPPLGAGSLELATAGGSDKVYALNFDHVNTPLSAVDALGYSTYRSSGSAQQVASINLQADINGAAPGGFTTLVFEPVYNTAQGSVVNGQWQTWDAYGGGSATWWSSNPIPGAPNRDTFVSWNTITSMNPDAVVLGYGINQGSGNGSLTTAVDALKFGASGTTTTYDFEPTLTPTSKDQCKNGGWQTFNSPKFKNQGDCVSYTNNGK
jgi:hypothetical protein